jgi:nucleoside-diphosphate-sugar epimerase
LLVIGGEYPVGQVITRLLVSAGHQVAAHVHTTASAHQIRQNGALPVYGDLQRVGELRGLIQSRKIEVVINLESQAPNHIPLRPAHWDTESLMPRLVALQQAAAEGGASFLIHTSYATVYGDQHGAWVDETTRPEPGENELLRDALRAEKQALSGPTPACVLRLGFLYGAESTELQSLREMLIFARPLIAGKGYANWLHYHDAAEAIRRVAEAKPVGEIFNVVDNAPASSIDFLAKFAQSLGLNAPNSAPGFLAPLLTNRDQIALMAQSVRVKNARISQALGWRPAYPTLTAGFDEALLTWRTRAIV